MFNPKGRALRLAITICSGSAYLLFGYDQARNALSFGFDMWANAPLYREYSADLCHTQAFFQPLGIPVLVFSELLSLSLILDVLGDA